MLELNRKMHRCLHFGINLIFQSLVVKYSGQNLIKKKVNKLDEYHFVCNLFEFLMPGIACHLDFTVCDYPRYTQCTGLIRFTIVLCRFTIVLTVLSPKILVFSKMQTLHEANQKENLISKNIATV